MGKNIINNLTVIINEKNYDDVYVTFGIKFGFAVSKIIILPSDEVTDVNSASGNLFANYIKLYLKKKFRIYIKTKVKDNMMYLSFKNSSEKMDDILEKVVKSLYEFEVDELIFNEAKKITIDNFKESYKNPEFRAYYKLLEFVHMHKNFQVLKLINDIKNLNLEDFIWFKNNIVCPENSVLFMNGKVSFLEESKLPEILEKVKKSNHTIVQAANIIDDYITNDACVAAKKGYDVKIGCIKLDFLNSTISMLDRQALLQIISTIMFKEDSYVILDEFDSGIIYFKSELKPYKNSIRDNLTKEKVESAKKYIINLFNNLYENNPYAFNECYVEFYSKNIDFTEYINAIENCDEELINKVFTLGDIKIIEGQVMYTGEK